ncbi:MAG: ABC transporter permease [Rhizobiales bacterium]|jgi:NitT/TauT family transport system permease protein|nr:ABC transporter permease [Hyphomicrobiales bacterium]
MSASSPGAVRRLFTRAGPWRDGIIGFAVLFVAWEAAARLLDIPRYILPAPTVIWSDFLERYPRMMDAAVTTAGEIVLGFILSVLVSIPLAILISYSRPIERSVMPIIVALQIIPKIAIAPLFIIWFGFGLAPKLLLVFLLCFFPILVSATTGLRSVPSDVLDLARSTGTTEFLVFRKIRLPHALPSIFTGLKVAATLATTAAIVAEFVASDRGLGYMLLEFNGNLETGMVFATVILLSFIGVALYSVVEFIERRAVSWHVSQRSQAGSNPLIGS